MRGGERERHSDAASVRGSGWRVLRASAAAFWCGEQVLQRAGAVSVCCVRVRRRDAAGAACWFCERAGRRRVGAAFGCGEPAQRRLAGAAAFGIVGDDTYDIVGASGILPTPGHDRAKRYIRV